MYRHITKYQKQNNIIPNVTPKNVTKVKDFFNILVHDAVLNKVIQEYRLYQ